MAKRTKERPEVRMAQVELNGVKLVDQKVALDALTVLLGLPGTGKSSVISAICIAALGYEPSRGNTEAKTAKLMRDDRLLVRVALTDSRWFQRSLTRKGSSFQGEALCSWLPPTATSTEHGEAIRGLFGASDVEAAEHLDLGELMRATANARAARIEALLAATALNPADAERWLLGLTLCRLAKVDEDRLPEDPQDEGFARATEGLKALLEHPIAARFGFVCVPVVAELHTGTVGGAIVSVNSKKKESAIGLKQKKSAHTEIEDRARALTVPAETLDALNERRQKATDRMAELKGALERQATTQRAAVTAREAATKALLAVEGHPARKKAVEDARARIDASNAELRAAVDPAEVPALALREPDQVKASRANGLLLEASALDAEADKAVGAHPTPPTPRAVPSTIADEKEVHRCEDALERARTGPWARIIGHVEAITKRLVGTPQAADVATHVDAIRKTCEANGGGDIEPCTRALAEAREAQKAARRAADEVEKANRTASSAYAAAKVSYDQAVKASTKQREKASAKRMEAEQLRTAALSAVAEYNDQARIEWQRQVDERSAAVTVAVRARRRIIREIEIAQDFIDAEVEKIAEEERAHAGAQGRVAGVHAARPEDLSKAPEQVAMLQVQVDAIDEAKQAVEGADALHREMSTLAAEIEAAGSDHAILTAVEWALQRLRERDLAARGGPLIDRMRKFLLGAGLPFEPFLRATKGSTDFGWVRRGKEVSIDTFGGGETALFMAALGVAVIALRRPELRVLLVEAAEAGGAALATRLLRGVQAMRGDLDNAVVATCYEPEIPEGAWAVIEYPDTNATVAS